MISLLQAAQLLGGGNYIELFEVDLTPVNGPVLYLHNAIAVGSQTILWKGEEYSPYPIAAQGFEATSADSFGNPKLTVANLDGVVYSLCLNYRDLLGAIVRCHRTLFFTDGTGRIVDTDGAPVLVAAGPNDPLPTFQEWIFEFEINQRSSDTGATIEFTLKAQPDSTRKVPGTFVSAHFCQHLYRGGMCPYAGTALFDRTDTPIPWSVNRGAFDLTASYIDADMVYILNNGVRSYYVAQGASTGVYPAMDPALWARDTCSKTARPGIVSGCTCRFGQQAVLPARLFPATSRLSN